MGEKSRRSDLLCPSTFPSWSILLLTHGFKEKAPYFPGSHESFVARMYSNTLHLKGPFLPHRLDQLLSYFVLLPTVQRPQYSIVEGLRLKDYPSTQVKSKTPLLFRKQRNYGLKTMI